MLKFTKTLPFLTALCLPYAAQADVLASVKPLGFIAAALTDGVTDTKVLMPTGASPHDYSLKLSDVQKIKQAGLVLWIGKDVDAFLTKPLSQLDTKKVLTIADFPEIQPLLGKGFHDHGNHEHEHEHEHDHHHAHDHDHGHDHDTDENGLSINWHVWYSPDISLVVAEKLAIALTARFPDKQDKIAENLAAFNHALTRKNAEIQQQLAMVKDKGFYVFHDAYGYFNQAYGLNQTGYFTVNPLVAPGAKTLAKIKGEIAAHKVACLFAEPQFTPKVIDSLKQGTAVNIGRLDPIGEPIPLNKHAYVNFLQFTADSYLDCLK